MEVDGSAAAASASAATPAAELQLLPPAAPYEQRLASDAATLVASDALAATSPARLALLLSRAGHDAFVRRAPGNAWKRRSNSASNSGGEGAAAAAAPIQPPLQSRAIFETLSHAFVVVRPPQPSSSSHLLVVDAGFRDAVAVVAPPPRLAKVLDALPRVFVGGAARLDEAVRRVAAETRLALEAEGRPLPPWRSARALLSKWMPQGAGAVVDERPSEEMAAGGSSACSTSSAAAARAGAASGLSPPTTPTSAAAAAGCCSPFSTASDGYRRSLSTSLEGAFAGTSSSAAVAATVPPTALGGGGGHAATPPIALVEPPLVARLSVSLLSSSLARVSASASSAAATASAATKASVAAAMDEMRPVRRATWAPAT